LLISIRESLIQQLLDGIVAARAAASAGRALLYDTRLLTA
jgi:hypothetical protein